MFFTDVPETNSAFYFQIYRHLGPEHAEVQAVRRETVLGMAYSESARSVFHPSGTKGLRCKKWRRNSTILTRSFIRRITSEVERFCALAACR